jgi:hypothetical protein
MTNDELNPSAANPAIRHSSFIIEVSAALIFRKGALKRENFTRNA